MLRRQLPAAFELVYDNYNALAIGFSPTERTPDAIVSVTLYPRWVSLFFLYGATLPIRCGCSQGSGKQVRSIRLETAAVLEDARRSTRCCGRRSHNRTCRCPKAAAGPSSSSPSPHGSGRAEWRNSVAMKRAGLACTIAVSCSPRPPSAAAPSVRSADVRDRVRVADLVRRRFDARRRRRREVEHRLDAAPGSRHRPLEVGGAARVGEPADVGTTRALVLRPEDRATPCATPSSSLPSGRADARSGFRPSRRRAAGEFSIVARIPAGATATGTMPSFDVVG